MSNSPNAAHAHEIVEYWRTCREAARHIERAIRLYYGLLQGDTTLLRQFFPMLSLNTAAQYEQAYTSSGVEQKSSDDDLADFLDSLGV